MKLVLVPELVAISNAHYDRTREWIRAMYLSPVDFARAVGELTSTRAFVDRERLTIDYAPLQCAPNLHRDYVLIRPLKGRVERIALVWTLNKSTAITIAKPWCGCAEAQKRGERMAGCEICNARSSDERGQADGAP